MGNKFKPRSITETVSLLCFAKGGSFIRAGKVNHSEIARKAGTTQTNVSRWFASEHQPTDESIKLLAKAFKVTPAQIRGEMPIGILDGIDEDTALQKEICTLLKQLPVEFQALLRDQLCFYAKAFSHRQIDDGHLTVEEADKQNPR